MLKQIIWAYLSTFSSFVKGNQKYFSIAGIAALIAVFQALGIWNTIINGLTNLYSICFNFIKLPWEAPILIWITLFLSLLFIFYRSVKDNLYLHKVAGEFHDDFKKGLKKWDYKGDWRIEEENGKALLSVADSPIGGFTKKGFNWTDYEFSFETKVIKNASGWVIRANASDYFMVQLYLDGNPAYRYKLRPHYHKLEGGTEIWLPLDKDSVDLFKIQLEREIKLLQWIKVKIVVEGNQVDIFLDEKHALHYLISTVGVSLSKKFTIVDERGKKYEATTTDIVPLGSNAAGRVGFRSGDGEHAHFRNVNVKPL